MLSNVMYAILAFNEHEITRFLQEQRILEASEIFKQWLIFLGIGQQPVSHAHEQFEQIKCNLKARYSRFMFKYHIFWYLLDHLCVVKRLGIDIEILQWELFEHHQLLLFRCTDLHTQFARWYVFYNAIRAQNTKRKLFAYPGYLLIVQAVIQE